MVDEPGQRRRGPEGNSHHEPRSGSTVVASCRPSEALLAVDGADSQLRSRIREEPPVRLFAFRYVWRWDADGVLAGHPTHSATAAHRRSAITTMRRHDTIAATLLSLTHAFGTALVSEQVARRPGLLQAFDPRVRVIGLFALVLAVILSHRISVIVALFVVAVLLAVLSQVNLKSLAIRVWLMVLLFTSVIALPSVFLTPGDPIVTFPAGALD